MARSDYSVRVAAREDLDELLTLRSELGARAPGPATVQEIETWHTMMSTPALSIYLAELDKHAVGTATSMMIPNLTYECAPTLLIEAVSVLPGHRRQGVASRLLKKCLADARASGCDKVQLLSHKRHAVDGSHEL